MIKFYTNYEWIRGVQQNKIMIKKTDYEEEEIEAKTRNGTM